MGFEGYLVDAHLTSYNVTVKKRMKTPCHDTRAVIHLVIYLLFINFSLCFLGMKPLFKGVANRKDWVTADPFYAVLLVCTVSK